MSGFHVKPDDLHGSGSTLGEFGDKIAQGGQKLQSAGEKLVSHAGRDKSGIGSVVSKAMGKGLEVTGKVFEEGGRVAGAAGKRLHTSADAYDESDNHGAGLLNKIHGNKDSPHVGSHDGKQGGGKQGGSGSGGGHVDPPPTPHGSSGSSGGGGSSEHRPGDPHTVAKPPQSRCVGGDPVDVVSGEVVIVDTDVDLRGVLALVLRRTHISSYRSGRSFGRTWCSTLDQRLVFDDQGVLLLGDDGVVLVYPHPQPGEPVLPVAGAAWPLSLGEDGGYRVSDPLSGRTLDFGPRAGAAELPLRTIGDRNGNTVLLRRDERGTPVEVVHSGGYRIVVLSAEGLVTELALARDGEADLPLIHFRYQDTLLTEVINSSGLSMRFAYDDAGRVLRWEDRNGFWYRYDYGADGRCTRGEGSEGFLNATFAYDPQARLTAVTDAVGSVRHFHYDVHGQVVREVDPLGAETVSAWDARGRLLSRTDPLGATTTYGTDEQGSLVSLRQPDGTEFSAAYNDFGQPTRITEPSGAVWQRGYDERGNLTSVTDPLGATTTYTCDEHGRPVSTVDALGGVARYTTDAAGLCLSSTDPAGATTRFQRDAFGRAIAVTDPMGGTTRFGWTVEGKLTWRGFADGTAESWRYDGEGNLVEHVDQAGARSTFGYTAFDQLVWQVEPGGARTGYAYDKELRLLAVTNPLNAVWRYDYDAAGNLIGETDFAGRVLGYAHDAAGRLSESRNGTGDVLRFERDPMGRVVRRGTADAPTELAYDPAGRLVRAATVDAVSEFGYDLLGRVLSESTGGRTLTASYDPLGRRLSRLTPGGVRSTWTYDAAGNPASVDSDGTVLRFEHDALGREVRRQLGTVALEQTWEPTHLLRAQALSVQAPDDTRGPRLVQRRSYTYRADGYPVAVVDQLAGPREFALDPAGRVSAVSGAGWQERYGYDALGNLTSAQAPDESPAPAPFEYAGGRLRAAGRNSYQHDDNGRIVVRRHRTLSGQLRTWRYEWDAEDRLRSVTTPDGTRWRYGYDAFGRRVSKLRLTADGEVAERVDFCWDGTVLAEQQHSVDGRARRTTWDWVPHTARPLAQSERTTLADAPQDTVDRAFYAIVTDLIGTPCELVDESGAVASRMSGSLWGTTFGIGPDAPSVPFRFPGQYADAETGLHYNVFRYYDPAIGRYYSEDPLGLGGGPNPAAYVANPTCWADPLGLGKCLAATGTPPNHTTTMSGWQMPRPQGISHVDPQHIIDLENQMGFPLKNGGAFDQGTLGKYFASHAERQATYLNPDTPVRVDKPMCNDCQAFFRALAQHRGSPQMVSDPDNHRIFHPDGSVETTPHNIPFSLGTIT